MLEYKQKRIKNEIKKAGDFGEGKMLPDIVPALGYSKGESVESSSLGPQNSKIFAFLRNF